MTEKNYLVDPETGAQFPIGGCLISHEPSNLPKFGASQILSSQVLPPSVDLRQLMTPVENQGQLNSCVGNALAGAYEFLIMKDKKKHIDISRLFIYYNSRNIDGSEEYNMMDRGTFIRSAIAGLKKFGCCKEEMYPYNHEYVNQKPPTHCYTEAKNYRIMKAEIVQTELNEMKACLAEGFPFAFGLELFQSFVQAGKDAGRVPMPKPQYEVQSAQHGWHAMLAVGYSDASQCFIVRNSWGEDWGDNGYCYIPYTYMCNPQHCQDIHVIHIVADNFRRNQRETIIENSYDWNVNKDEQYHVPSDYPFPDFDFKFFWKLNDTFNYFHSIWNNGKKMPFAVWKMAQSEARTNMCHKIMPCKTDFGMSFILWIDKKNNENAYVEKQLINNKNVKVDFCGTLSKAESHLLKHMHKIKASSTFQIICRGYYKDEDKNPLNLLYFLNNYKLNHIPVLVFTQDKSGLLHHLQNQAPSMGINDWKQRLFITNSSEELIRKSKENMGNKHISTGR